MAALRGQRFNIDLSDDETDAGPNPGAPSIFGSLVRDIQERPASGEKAAPTAPSLSNRDTTGGFPAHKKRTSRFKAARVGDALDDPLPSAATSSITLQRVNKDEEKSSIDAENKKRLASMSPAEIERERKDLMASLSPALLKRLLARATIDDDGGPQDFPGTASPPIQADDATVSLEAAKPTRRVAFVETDSAHETGAALPKTPYASSFPEDLHDDDYDDGDSNKSEIEDEEVDAQPSFTTPQSRDSDSPLTSSTTHFPRPPQPPPTLDPTSPTFLADLHTKYFPSLPSDPSKLAWMSSPSQAPAVDPSEDHSYNPLFGADSIPVTQLRFGFAGDLLPPSVSIGIGVDKGLHHHGDNPEAAGYTIPELAHLARSSVPSQRCVSFQLLGRILYRLGLGEFGGWDKKGRLATVDEDGEDEDAGGENWQEGAGRRGGGNTVLETGMWDCMQRGRVIETLQEEVARERGHISAKAYATEALWLWQKGGGKKVMAT